MQKEEKMDEFIQGVKSHSSDSYENGECSSPKKSRKKLDSYNVHDVKNSSNIITASKSLVCYSSTSDDENSDYFGLQTSTDNIPVQVSVDTGPVLPEHNSTASSTSQTKTKQKMFPPRENTSRKRKRAPQSWKRNKAAILREKGEAYSSYSGKNIPKKIPYLGTLCSEVCPLKCSIKFNQEQREKLFTDFHKLKVNAKNALLYNCISKIDIYRRRSDAKKKKSSSFVYMVKNGSETVRVCKSALSALFSIGRGKIDHIQKSIKSGRSVPPLDGRGKHVNRPHGVASEVADYIENHINSFPAEESHYSRTKNIYKKYLSPLLSLKKMYDLYLEQVNTHDLPEQFKISESTYRNIFSSKFNLSFGNPRSDTCNTCEKGDVDETHIVNYHQAFELQKLDRELPKKKNEVVYLTIDLQQTMPLPKLSVSKAFYLRQLWFYNFGVHIVSESGEISHFFTWTEDVANRGSNEVASSLLTLLEFDEFLQSKDHLIIWSDSCAGQNKNSTLLFLFQYLVMKGYFKIIDQKFPEVGHSYLDSDRDFGRIEKNLRKHETIYLPEQYREIIAKSGKNHQVTDMTSHFRNFKNLSSKLNLTNRKTNVFNEKVEFRKNVKWIRVEEFGSYLYKECYDPNTPFKKVDLRKKNNIIKKFVGAGDFMLERATDSKAKLTAEKIQNLEQQLPFVKKEYKYFYNSLIQKEKD